MLKRNSASIILIGLAALMIAGSSGLNNVHAKKSSKIRSTVWGVKTRSVNIWSDGTRLSGDLWYPEDFKKGDKRPAFIMCQGWGGNRAYSNSAYAPLFAKAGYVVLTFDYRGWGDSDSRLVIKGKMPRPDKNGMVKVRAQAIRELVDPFDQTEDIMNCISFLSGEPGVDPKRIGLWGTSFGGGHVVYVAAKDSRVKCVVSQVPSMSGSWVHTYYRPFRLATLRARGENDPVPQGVNKAPGLNGTPYLARIARYSPVSFAEKIRVPVFILVAEYEELIKNEEHGLKVYNIIKRKVPSKYEVFSGTHFEIYSKERIQSINMAIKWYDKHLK